MATVPPGQPGQPQHDPPKQPLQHDHLQSMVNMMYVHLGRYLRELQRGEPNGGRLGLQLKRILPAAAERFNDALDELENEVQEAQAVLRRDLAVLQADRRKREQAEAAERQRIAAASSAKKQAPATVDEPAITKTVEPSQPEPVPTRSEPAQPETVQEAIAKEPDLPPPIDTSSAPQTERDPLFDGTPTTANPQDQDFDFDAMFGDGALDEPTEVVGDSMDIDNSAPDLSFTLDDSGPSLLRGLEDFAKGDDDTAAGPDASNTNIDLDFAMPDLPDLEPADPPAPPEPQNSNNNQPSETTNTEQATAENADAALFQDIATDDLDDLFNTDSQFDDAFFFTS
ncbi:hypothetical protein EJ04DRAFT_572455 [Polyplosphaeria fusca]|uniref:Uncharacterized protein n=1 Tax=Polyplosphaeria fusca TaxID=682080 RepID=A0A9P4V518_9PLEO|nr:hypothetical protein EJ04DRAFT_572455 [Polyplosphaeria fusca]